MTNIILREEAKHLSDGRLSSKALSLHGSSAASLVRHINDRLATIQYLGKANNIQFEKKDLDTHFCCEMNEACFRNHEEDVFCAILDVMESHDFVLRFEYDQQVPPCVVYKFSTFRDAKS